MKAEFRIACAAAVALISQISAEDQFKWGTVTMGGGGFVSAIITSKTQENVIYARTDVGGAYRWNETGQSWIPLTDWVDPDNMGLLGIDALALDPSNPQKVYMLAGTEYWNNGKTMILRSDDYGATFDTINVTSLFKTHGNGYGRQNGERLAVDPNNPQILFCGTRNNGLWKSADRGSTWTNVTGVNAPANGQGICFVVFDKTKVSGGATRRIFIGLSAIDVNLYVSDDAGLSWTSVKMPDMSKPVMPQRAVLTPGGKYLYITTANGAGPGFGNGVTISRGAVLRYDTESKQWKDISPENWIDDPPNPEYPGQYIWDAHFGGFGGITMNPDDSSHIIVSSINAWKPQRWDNSDRAGWGDKIFVTSDAGSTWTNVFGDFGDAQISEIPGDAPVAVVHKNGYNWIEGESIHWAGSVEFDPFNPKRVFVTSGNGIYMADDFSPGKRFTWKFTVRGLEETVPENLVSIPGGPLITVIGDYDGFVHTDITRPVSGSRHYPQIGSTTGLDFAKLSPNIIVRAGGNDKPETDKDYVFPLYYSTDTAKTWTKFATHTGAGQNYKGRIAVSSDGTVVLWNPEGRSALYRTDDWGRNWSVCAGISASKCFPVADPLDPEAFYAFSGEVYRSTDKGMTFAKAGSRNFSWTNDMQVAPGRQGHIWVTGYAWDGINGGYLARSVDGGKTFEEIDPANNPVYTQRIQHCEAVGFGKEALQASYPAIYIYGTIGGVKGIYQSVDEAKTWVRIDDDKHRYGALANGNFIRGDANTFGVVYRSTAGRGIAARMPAGWGQVSSKPIVSSPVRKKYPMPEIGFSGGVLTIKSDGGDIYDVAVYNPGGRRLFKKTCSSSVTIPIHSVIRANGAFLLAVRGAGGYDSYCRMFQMIR